MATWTTKEENRLRIKRKLNCDYYLGLSLEEVVLGTTRKIDPQIAVLCLKCKANNLVKPRGKHCPECHGEKAYVFAIHMDIDVYPGMKQGDRQTIVEEGSFGPNGMRGDIIVHFFDKPHDYILRANNDLIVTFKIDYIERSSRVSRWLNTNIPGLERVFLQTQDGVLVSDNSMWFVPELGLADPNTQLRGRLIVLFLVRTKKSNLPVKLENLLVNGTPAASVFWKPKGESGQEINSDETDEAPSPKKLRTDSPTNLPLNQTKGGNLRMSKNTGNGVKKRKSPKMSKNGSANENKDLNDGKVEKVLSEFVGDGFDFLTRSSQSEFSTPNLRNLSFEDRLTSTGAIPLPYKQAARNELTIMEIRYLWSLKNNPDWTKRISECDTVFEDPNERIYERYREERNSDIRRLDHITEELPVFDVKDESADQMTETCRIASTGFVGVDAEVANYVLTKMNAQQRRETLTMTADYHNVPSLFKSSSVFYDECRWFS